MLNKVKPTQLKPKTPTKRSLVSKPPSWAGVGKNNVIYLFYIINILKEIQLHATCTRSSYHIAAFTNMEIIEKRRILKRHLFINAKNVCITWNEFFEIHDLCFWMFKSTAHDPRQITQIPIITWIIFLNFTYIPKIFLYFLKSINLNTLQRKESIKSFLIEKKKKREFFKVHICNLLV